jgi:hypothetical protein
MACPAAVAALAAAAAALVAAAADGVDLMACARASLHLHLRHQAVAPTRGQPAHVLLYLLLLLLLAAPPCHCCCAGS